jgi:ribosomal protein S18 acetylase RimI-like enzyme
MLETGKYRGIWKQDKDGSEKLVCVCGVHVYSKELKVASLGNIATHPSFRNQGLAKRAIVKLIKFVI